MSQRLHVDRLGRPLVIAIAAGILLSSTGKMAHSQIASTSTIVFVSTRDEPGADPTADPQRAWAATEIYSIKADGTGKPVRLTNNAEEERAPSWSPDGKRIAFCCRRNGPDFEICVMNADGTGQIVLTDNAAPDLTPTWSPDARKIVFHRPLGGAARFQLFSIAIDGSGETQLTFPPGLNAFPNWDAIRQRRGVSPGRQ